MKNPESFLYKAFAFCFFYFIGVVLVQNLFVFFTPFFLKEYNYSMSAELFAFAQWGVLLFSIFLSFVFMFRIDAVSLEKSWMQIRFPQVVKEIGLGLLIISAYIFVYLGMGFRLKFVDSEIRNPGNPGTIFLLALFSGISEELPLRGYLLHLFSRNQKTFAGIAAISFYFAMLHISNTGMNLLVITNLFLVGVFLSLVTLYTKSIYPAISMHVSFNFLEIILFGFGNLKIEQSTSVFTLHRVDSLEFIHGGPYNLTGSLILTVLLIVSVLFLIMLVAYRSYQRE